MYVEIKALIVLITILEVKVNFVESKVNYDELFKSAIFSSENQIFSPAYSENVTESCKLQANTYMTALALNELWALRIYDANAKLSSGILRGNINQFGDYDQCLMTTSPSNNIYGKYCLAEFELKIEDKNSTLFKIYNEAINHGLFQSGLSDPSHLLPRYNVIHWGLCVPSACTADDVENVLNVFVKEKFPFEIKIMVEPEACHTQKEDSINNASFETKIVWILMALYLIGIGFSTLFEYRNGQNEWICTFSLIKNSKEIFSLKTERNDIECLHGIRFFHAMLLVLSHKMMVEAFKSYTNRAEMGDEMSQPWSVVGRQSVIFTDTFLLISAFLTTYSLLGRLNRGQIINLPQEYLTRFFRIAPPLLATILLYIFVFPYLGSGPMWHEVVANNAEICKKYWWRNLLFIHNYFGFENICVTHTHHIGTDMQLYLASPIFIYAIFKYPKKGLYLTIASMLIISAQRFFVIFNSGLANFVYFGMSGQHALDSADFLYIRPYYRAPIYLLGILLGYVCREYKAVKLTKLQLWFGWIFTSILCVLSLAGPAHTGTPVYTYNRLEAAIYSVFSPFAWNIFIAWIIFTAFFGYKNFLVDIFSWKYFKITTRISYAMYLMQFYVFYYSVGQARAPEQYSFVKNIVFCTNEYVMMYAASYLLTVLIENPFGNIKKLIFPSSKPNKPLDTNNNADNCKKTI